MGVLGQQKDQGSAVWFDWNKAERRVGIYYFYVVDPDFGPGFIKICTYFPYPAKVWVNGHEWAKRQADRDTALSNGFAACADPEELQMTCDRFCAEDVQGFFDRWIVVIPTPLSGAETQPRATGGNSRCVKSRCRWCSMIPAGPAGSSKPSSPTTSPSDDPRPSQ